jgi:hypothetical protein
MQRISRVRNRMREICASGSVGGEGGNILAYPAGDKLPTRAEPRQRDVTRKIVRCRAENLPRS